MLFSPKELSIWWGIRPTGVVHVGAHLAEESKSYSELDWGEIIWIEAQKHLAEKLVSSLSPEKNKVICAAIWDEADIDMNLLISSNSQSSSLLNFGPHFRENGAIKITGKQEVKTKRLDQVLPESLTANFINLDIQGVELRALISLGERISQFDYVYTEVNSKYVYEQCALIRDIDLYLSTNGFSRIGTRWRLFRNWGDAIYVRQQREHHINNLTKLFQFMLNTNFYFRQIIDRTLQFVSRLV